MNGAAAMVVPDAVAFEVLMGELHHCFGDNAAQVADRLPALLDTLSDFSFGPGESSSRRELFEADDLPSLPFFLESLRSPIEIVGSLGLMGNPWAAASLRRDEVRNAAVLRWFLDPRGGHGCGNALLVDLLERVRRHLPGGFFTRPSQRCSVAVEENPDGDRTNRVDIQIDDPSFYLVVEVKIGAPEQNEQVKRYCDVAAARASGARPWALIFLTPDGKLPRTAAAQIVHVVPMSWGHVAASLRRIARSTSDVPRFLAMSFASHIAHF